jgi:hypothetical protein
MFPAERRDPAAAAAKEQAPRRTVAQAFEIIEKKIQLLADNVFANV